ncbi:hypothetical protein GBAR_LOCUS24801 [Geodia barretti]|nr:hypothetical protein GBAR_LOCUS24801 [Geodia barretti]
MAPDPAVSPVDAALYFRCRKCRQLLFTDGDVLQHALGEGRESFGHRHRGKSDRSKYHGEGVLVMSGKLEAKEKEGELLTTVDKLPEMKKEAVIEEAEEKQRATVELKDETVELQLATEIGSQEEIECVQKAPRELGWSDGGTCERAKREEDGLSEDVVLGGNPDCRQLVSMELRGTTPLITPHGDGGISYEEGGRHSTCSASSALLFSLPKLHFLLH